MGSIASKDANWRQSGVTAETSPTGLFLLSVLAFLINVRMVTSGGMAPVNFQPKGWFSSSNANIAYLKPQE